MTAPGTGTPLSGAPKGPGLPILILTQMLLALAIPGSAMAQGWLEPARPRAGASIQRLKTEVRVEVTGNVATVVVDEWFQSDGPALGEVDYLYPLPRDAVFTSFSLYQGEEELRGEIMDAQRAREIYQEIVRRRKDPALIELVGLGLLRARVFPLDPGEARRVTLRFTMVLDRAGDALHLRYAGGVPASTSCWNGGSTAPNGCAGAPSPASLEVRVAPGSRFLDPFSPTHSLRTQRDGEVMVVRAQGSLAGSFSLFLPLAREGLGLTLVTHRPAGEDGYFLLSLSPGRGEAPPEPRDVTVVLDVSGSMSGEKIRQARGALQDLLGTLTPGDRFRLMAFSNAVRPMSLDWLAVTPGDLDRARTWVGGLEADGGTNISGALAEALRLESPRNRLPVVIFLTDGLPTVGETSVESILRSVAERRGRARVFAFGVGHDVNTALLDRMSEEGRGSTHYVVPGESVERALSLLAAKIHHPVLTDLALVRAPVRIKEVYPVEIPDVFAGEELILFGRYEGGGGDLSGELVLEGRRGGERLRFPLEAAFPGHEEGNAFVPRLWASRKLGFLTRRVWTEGPSQELLEEIRETALRYGLPSPYTSYLVLEPGMPGDPGMGRPGVPGGLPVLLRDQAPRPEALSVQGEGAVRRARTALALRAVASEAELAAMGDAALEPALLERQDLRSVGGRLFRLDLGVWREVQDSEGSRTLDVAPFGRGYFQLLELLPELGLYAQAFSQVEIQGKELRIRFVEGGREELSRADLRAAERGFRGR
jgi:Ca-activated chloride channel homolog